VNTQSHPRDGEDRQLAGPEPADDRLGLFLQLGEFHVVGHDAGVELCALSEQRAYAVGPVRQQLIEDGVGEPRRREQAHAGEGWVAVVSAAGKTQAACWRAGTAIVASFCRRHQRLGGLQCTTPPTAVQRELSLKTRAGYYEHGASVFLAAH
jgi:hypothetical protein